VIKAKWTVIDHAWCTMGQNARFTEGHLGTNPDWLCSKTICLKLL